MTTEELLKPRYKVIADYPNSVHKIGSIILTEDYAPFDRIKYYRCADYHHLFRKLEWWEDRKPENMPEYVNTGKKILKVTKWHIDKDVYEYDVWFEAEGGHPNGHTVLTRVPATKEEYDLFINQKPKQ